MIERGNGKCVRCQDYKGGCTVHERRMRKELARYFGLARYAQNFDRDYDRPCEWTWATVECSVIESILASFMMVYSKDYGACRHTPGTMGGKDVALTHGRLDIAFKVKDLVDRGTTPARTLDHNYFTIPAGSKYFAMGAVFDFAVEGHQFCCLFEDGKYFLSDVIATTTTTTTTITTNATSVAMRCEDPAEGPFAQALQRIKGLVETIVCTPIPPPSLTEGAHHYRQ